ncbi:MAG: hypothetical protein QW165_03350 [Candidatus Woesearchaeota archaeon]
MNKNVVIAIVLGALVLIAGVQAFQLFSLKEKLASGQISTSAPTASGSGGSPQLPSNLQNLPEMVGGC